MTLDELRERRAAWEMEQKSAEAAYHRATGAIAELDRQIEEAVTPAYPEPVNPSVNGTTEPVPA